MSNPGYCPDCKESGWACRCGRTPLPMTSDNTRAVVELTGYTPGPWTVDGFNEVLAGDPCLDLMVIGQGGYIVAQMVPERDACLIAAAPTMRDLIETLTADNARLREALEDAADNLEYAEQMLHHTGNDAGAGFCQRQCIKFRAAITGLTEEAP